MTRTVLGTATILILLGLLLTGCAPSQPDCGETGVFCVGLVIEVGGLDENALDQAAWEGISKARIDGLADWAAYIETVNWKDYEKNIATFAEVGYDLIVTVGYNLGEATQSAAEEYPDIYFVGVDQSIENEEAALANLAILVFPEDQAGFLVGALAALMSETGKIGAVCGTDEIASMWRYCEGYRNGAAYTDPEVEVFVIYHNEVSFDKTFDDPAWGAKMANTMVDMGADVIFGAGGETGSNAVIAAAMRGVYAIGADSDQYEALPEAASRLLSSALKLASPGIYALIKLAKEAQVNNDDFPSGEYLGSAGYAPYHDLEDEVPDEVKEQMEAMLRDLTEGLIETYVTTEK